MNSIDIQLRQILQLEKHGIVFRDCIFVEIIVDGKNLLNDDRFGDALVYFDQLLRSKKTNGTYLIFTCACGVADDGGYAGVRVYHQGDSTTWTIERDGIIQYTFRSSEYSAAIDRCGLALSQLSPNKLEPKHVTFPDDWEHNKN